MGVGRGTGSPEPHGAVLSEWNPEESAHILGHQRKTMGARKRHPGL